ncbi:MAG: glycosyl hydrolase [Bacteroidetes bacterium]|nr:glycosyl hydrolase [Bacteroidota bacterium]
MIFRLLFILLLSSLSVSAQTVSVGAGSYTTALPTGATILPNNPAPGTSHYQRVDNADRTGALPKVVPGFSQPIQTNDWWSSAIWSYEMPNSVYYPDWLISPYSFLMHPHPLIIQATRYGLNVSYENNPVFSNNANGGMVDYHVWRENHLWVGLDGMDVPASTGTKVKSYGDWSVTMQWDDGAGRVLEATSGHGSPYVYFKKTGSSNPTLRYIAGTPVPFASISNATIEARGVTLLGKHYGIFCPPGTTLSASYILNQMEGDMAYNNVPRDAQKVQLPAGQNYFSVAVLPDNSPATLAYYAKFAFAFVTDTKVSWEYDECKSVVRNTFTCTTVPQGNSTETKTLMAMYPHQWKNIDASSPAAATAYSYPSTARGEMKVYEGSSFVNSHTNHGFLPGMPDYGTYDKTKLYNYVQAELVKGKNFFFYADNASLAVYGAGVALLKVCDLIELADMVGHTVARDTFRQWTKDYLQRWFTTNKAAAPNDDQFYYDSKWQSLIGMPSAFESDRQLNDHHFGYGYFVKAAAIVAKFEPNNTWETQWGPMVEMLIKDVANWDRSNTQFPFLRNFDPYAGHSWASGHSNFTAGNNQESSSEAINFASGVALWGTETNNKTLRDLGAFLYATEIDGYRQYWQDEDKITYPSGNWFNTAGMVWGWGVGYQTWFGSAMWPGPYNPEYNHGISFLPINGSSLYLGLNQAAAADNYNEMTTNNLNVNSKIAAPHTDFKDIIWNFQALIDNASAKSTFAANEATYIPQTGETKAHTYQWIYSLEKLGTVDATITADMPTYAVFNKNGCKNYVVYNPAGAFAKTKVTFSDGSCFLLPNEDSMYVFNKCPETKIPDSIYVICPNNPVKLKAKDTTCATNYQWDKNGVNIGGANTNTYTASAAGTYHISYNISNCIVKKDTFIVQLKDTINETNITKTCNGTGTSYTLTFDISGGEAPYSVSVNGGATGGPGTLSGTSFTSSLIASGSAYSFIVTDKNSCDVDTISGSKSCSCISNAGTMKQTLIKICGDTAHASASHNNNEILDPNDVLLYYLHSGSGTNLGTVYATGNSPYFNFSSGMVYGTTYYISSVVGTDNGLGEIDLNDPCLSVAKGTPVVFNALPVVNLGTDTVVCQASTITLDAGVNGTYQWSTSETSKTISVSNANDYSVVVTDTNGCKDSDTVNVKNAQAPATPIFSETCNGISDYTVTFTLSGGDSLSYEVLVNGVGPGGPGVLLGNTFTSAPIPSGSAYSFIVKDKNNCTPNIVAGSKNCNCATSAGSMALTAMNVCENANAIAAAATGANLDADDALMYYLHSNNGTLLGTVFGTNTTPSFSFVNPMVYGTTYYISAVAGNSNGGGGIDLSDPCLSVSKGTPVVFNALPTPSIAGNDTVICGTDIQLSGNIASVGTGIWTVSSGSGTFSNITAPNATVNGLTAGTNTFVWTIVNGSCPSSSTSINVQSLLAPSLSDAGNDQVLCNMSTAILAGNSAQLSETGTWTVSSGSATIANANDAASSISGLTAGKTTLLWTISNGVCSSSDSVDIVIESLPSPALAGNDQSICSTTTTLSATVPVIGSGSWKLISGSANIMDVNSPSTQLTELTNGSSTTLLWTTSNGSCPSDTQSVIIKVKALPQINLGEDSTLCDGDNVLLNAGDTSTVNTYIWQDNSTKAQYLAKQPGQYIVRMSSGDCKEISDTIVFDGNCPYSFFVPNSFTPNGDNKNDVFTPSAYNILDFKMDIFNRWGENIFTSTDINTGWNGKGKYGHDSQIDVYVYKITFSVASKNEKTSEKSLIGRITLIR